MYLIPEEVNLEDPIDFEYENGLSKAPGSDAKVGRGDSAVVVEQYDRC